MNTVACLGCCKEHLGHVMLKVKSLLRQGQYLRMTSIKSFGLRLTCEVGAGVPPPPEEALVVVEARSEVASRQCCHFSPFSNCAPSLIKAHSKFSSDTSYVHPVSSCLLTLHRAQVGQRPSPKGQALKKPVTPVECCFNTDTTRGKRRKTDRKALSQ